MKGSIVNERKLIQKLHDALDKVNGEYGEKDRFCVCCHSNTHDGQGIVHAAWCPITEARKALSAESHPAPNPDLLLTEKQMQDIWERINKKAKIDVIGMVMKLYNGKIKPAELMDLISERCRLSFESGRTYPKLQSRPTTEQAREKIAKGLYNSEKLLMLGQELVIYCVWEQLESKYKEDWLKVADQILRLLPFPDEQGIRIAKQAGANEEHNRLKLGLIAVFNRTPINLWPVEAEKLIKSFESVPLKAGEPPQENQ